MRFRRLHPATARRAGGLRERPEEVRLVGDFRNRRDDVADFLAVLAETLDELRNVADIRFDGLHARDGRLHVLAALLGDAARLVDFLRCHVERLAEAFHIFRELLRMVVCCLDVRELFAAGASDIDDGVCDGLADLGGLVSRRRELFRSRCEVFCRLRDVAHELVDFLVHFLHGMRHRADLVRTCRQLFELGCILLAQREVARADDLHALRDF